MKKIITLTLFLAIISAVAGGVLSFVNDLTAPIILEQSIAAVKANLEVIFPGGTFSEAEYTDETGLVKGAYVAKDQGYVFDVETSGYSSTPIHLVVGFDNSGTIVGYEVLSHQETSGIGSKVSEADYKSKVIGKTSSESPDLISGATVSSTAVVKGINAAKSVFSTLSGVSVNTDTPVPVKEVLTLSSDFSEQNAKILDIVDGEYKVSAVGFYDEPNIFRIQVVDGQVTSIKLTGFNDTVGVGDAVDQTYLDTLLGKGINDEVDVITGVTYTSKSALAALQAVLKANVSVADLYSAESPKVESVDGNVYKVSAEGFHGRNVLKVEVADGKIVSVVFAVFEDTPEVAGVVNSDEYLSQFAGLEDVSNVDVYTGVTWTSKSVLAASALALEESKK